MTERIPVTRISRPEMIQSLVETFASGKCSVCGRILWRAANSSMEAIVTGDPLGEPDTLRCVMIVSITSTGTG